VVIGPLGPIFTVLILALVIAVAVVIRVRRELRGRHEHDTGATRERGDDENVA
jgi:hypothetical protein